MLWQLAALPDLCHHLRPACTQCQKQPAECLVWVSRSCGTAAGIGRVRTSWGSTQEAGALYGLMGHLPSSSQLEEIGLCYLDPGSPALAGMGFAAGTLPPLGASPDGFLRHEAASVPISSPEPNQLPLPSAPLMDTIPAINAVQQSRPSAAIPVAVQHPSSIPQNAMLQTPLGLQHAWAARPFNIPPSASWSEVVEIKNVSPFRQTLHTNRKGQVSISYAVSDNGPYQSVSACMACTAFLVPVQGPQIPDSLWILQVPTFWTPQLQLEMLAAGVHSALVVSRSATQVMCGCDEARCNHLEFPHTTPCCPAACSLQTSMSCSGDACCCMQCLTTCTCCCRV